MIYYLPPSPRVMVGHMVHADGNITRCILVHRSMWLHRVLLTLWPRCFRVEAARIEWDTENWTAFTLSRY